MPPECGSIALSGRKGGEPDENAGAGAGSRTRDLLTTTLRAGEEPALSASAHFDVTARFASTFVCRSLTTDLADVDVSDLERFSEPMMPGPFEVSARRCRLTWVGYQYISYIRDTTYTSF